MGDLSVCCGLCGKAVNPNSSYYLARRSKTVGNHDEWEYFGVAPVFFACSYEHFAAQLVELQLQWREISRHQPMIVPESPQAKQEK